MRSAHRKVLVTSIIAGAVLATAAAPQASAASVQCGDELTQHTVLTSDLVCGSTSDALVIGADGVTLDLAGHTILGPGSTNTQWAGVRVFRQAHVTIKAGTITGFQAGVVLDEATANVVAGLTVHGNDQGINLAGGGGHSVEGNTSYGNDRDGIRLGLSADNRVAKNTVTDNVFGIGVADGSARNVIEKNALAGNRFFGIALFANVTANRVEKNTVRDTTSGHGIQLNADTFESSVVKNDVSTSGLDGIHVDSPSTTITKNTAGRNANLGIFAVPGASDGGGNQASGNGNPAQCVGVACS